MRVLIGLGNPGVRHAADRHNVGARTVDVLALRWGVAMDRAADHAQQGTAYFHGEPVLLVKPQTYMNHSGESAAAIAHRYALAAAAFVVVHDDLDLPLARLRIRQGGGAGGHRGVESVISHLGDPGFVRVRIGIGRPTGEEDVADFVLRGFDPAERSRAEAALTCAADAVEMFLAEGLERAMNHFNGAPREPLAS